MQSRTSSAPSPAAPDRVSDSVNCVKPDMSRKNTTPLTTRRVACDADTAKDASLSGATLLALSGVAVAAAATAADAAAAAAARCTTRSKTTVGMYEDKERINSDVLSKLYEIEKEF